MRAFILVALFFVACDAFRHSLTNSFTVDHRAGHWQNQTMEVKALADIQSGIHANTKVSPDVCQEMAYKLQGRHDCWEHASYREIYCKVKTPQSIRARSADKDCAEEEANSIGLNYCMALGLDLLGASDGCWKYVPYRERYCKNKSPLSIRALKADRKCAEENTLDIGSKYCMSLAFKLVGAHEGCWEYVSYRERYCNTKGPQSLKARQADRICAEEKARDIGVKYCLPLAFNLVGAQDGCWDYVSYRERYCKIKAPLSLKTRNVDRRCAEEEANNIGLKYCMSLALNLLGKHDGCWNYDSYREHYCKSKAKIRISDQDC